MSSDTTFSAEGDTLVTFTYYYANGSKWRMEETKNGLDDGVSKEWHPNGQLASLVRFRDGKMVDTCKGWWDNGQPRTLSYYIHGKRQGMKLGWKKNGSLGFSGEYRHGKPVGVHRWIFEGGKPEEVRTHNGEGERHGLSQRWWEPGVLRDSVIYVNDEIVEDFEYFKNGELRYWYKMRQPGHYFEAGKFYDPSGKLVGEVRDGKGVSVIYDEDGNHRRTATYKHGKVVSEEWFFDEED